MKTDSLRDKKAFDRLFVWRFEDRLKKEGEGVEHFHWGGGMVK